MLGIKFIKVQPTVYLLQDRKGQVVREGAGLSFFYYAPNTSLTQGAALGYSLSGFQPCREGAERGWLSVSETAFIKLAGTGLIGVSGSGKRTFARKPLKPRSSLNIEHHGITVSAYENNGNLG